MDNPIADAVRKLAKQRFVKYGIPFFVLILGGSFAMEGLTSIRYDFRNKSSITPDEAEKYGIKMKKPGEVTLESEYDKIKKDLDIDTWENIRGPRPWESNVITEKWRCKFSTEINDKKK